MHTQEERPLLDDDSSQRDTLYERSERVAAALASTGDELRDLIADVNEGAAMHVHAEVGTHAKVGDSAHACMHAAGMHACSRPACHWSALVPRLSTVSVLRLGALCAGAAAALGAPDTPLAKAVRILNNQLQALTTIEARTGELEGRLAQLDVAAQ